MLTGEEKRGTEERSSNSNEDIYAVPPDGICWYSPHMRKGKQWGRSIPDSSGCREEAGLERGGNSPAWGANLREAFCELGYKKNVHEKEVPETATHDQIKIWKDPYLSNELRERAQTLKVRPRCRVRPCSQEVEQVSEKEQAGKTGPNICELRGKKEG